MIPRADKHPRADRHGILGRFFREWRIPLGKLISLSIFDCK